MITVSLRKKKRKMAASYVPAGLRGDDAHDYSMPASLQSKPSSRNCEPLPLCIFLRAHTTPLFCKHILAMFLRVLRIPAHSLLTFPPSSSCCSARTLLASSRTRCTVSSAFTGHSHEGFHAAPPFLSFRLCRAMRLKCSVLSVALTQSNQPTSPFSLGMSQPTLCPHTQPTRSTRTSASCPNQARARHSKSRLSTT